MSRSHTLATRSDSATWSPPKPSHLRVLQVIRRIPRGRVFTYGAVARAAGLEGRARWVGRILRDSPLADSVPWHRVVSSSGRISERSGRGPRLQRERLAAEGVELNAGGKINLRVYLWRVPSAVRRPRKCL